MKQRNWHVSCFLGLPVCILYRVSHGGITKGVDGKDSNPAWIARYVIYYLGKFDENENDSCYSRGYFSMLKKIKSTIYKTCLLIFQPKFFFHHRKIFTPVNHVLFYNCTQTNSTQKKLKMFD